MTELASFAAIALRMIQSEERLQQALRLQETLAEEMSHRVKNVFALAESMVRLGARSAASKDDLAAKLMGRLHALADAMRSCAGVRINCPGKKQSLARFSPVSCCRLVRDDQS
jgi:hypothetical protein